MDRGVRRSRRATMAATAELESGRSSGCRVVSDRIAAFGRTYQFQKTCRLEDRAMPRAPLRWRDPATRWGTRGSSSAPSDVGMAYALCGFGPQTQAWVLDVLTKSSRLGITSTEMLDIA